MQYLNVENMLLLLPLTFITTILFSSFTYKWIEKPFIELGKQKGFTISLAKQRVS